jgi:hypothetical protein
MVTPAKLPTNGSLSPLMRTFIMSSGVLAFSLVVALSLPTPQSGAASPEATKPLPVLTAEMAFEANPANADLKAAYARNLPNAQKAEAIAMLREAPTQGSAEAYY